MSVYEKSKELADIIRRSKEFTDLKQAKIVIDKNINLRKKIEEFKKYEQELYSGRIPVKQVETMVGELNKKLEDLRKIPEIDYLLRVEKNFNDMLQKVYQIITDSVDSGLK